MIQIRNTKCLRIKPHVCLAEMGLMTTERSFLSLGGPNGRSEISGKTLKYREQLSICDGNAGCMIDKIIVNVDLYYNQAYRKVLIFID